VTLYQGGMLFVGSALVSAVFALLGVDGGG